MSKHAQELHGGPPLLSYQQAEASKDRVIVYDHTEVKDVPSLRRCPYCTSTSVCIPKSYDNDGVCICRDCGWWKILRLSKVSKGWGTDETDSLSALAKVFDVASIEAPIEDLRRYLRRKPWELSRVNPKSFELLIRDCLRDQFNPCEVIHVGGTSDGGVDLILILADTTQYIVQVKRRENLDRNEGVEVVRSLNGVLFRDKMARGMIVTTAKGFTARAIAETRVQTPTEVPYDMKLIALAELRNMLHLEPVIPYEPWRCFL